MSSETPASPRRDIADLVEDLRRAEFNVGPSEAIDATLVLAALQARGLSLDDRAIVCSHLKPVFCKSAEQQRQFDALFDRWWDTRRGLPGPSPSADEESTRREDREDDRGKRDERRWHGFGVRGRNALIVAIATVIIVMVAGTFALRRWPPSTWWAAQPTPVDSGAAATPAPAATPDTNTSPGRATPLDAASPSLVDRVVPAQRYTVEIRPWWVWTLGALPLAVFLSITLPVLVLRRTPLRRRAAPMILDLATLEREARRLVPPLQEDIAAKLARHVSSRGIDMERQARRPSLDIRRTLEASLRNHGIPTLRFSLARVHPSYLVLVDAAHEEDPRGRLFFQWAERLQREGLDVELWLLRQRVDPHEPDALWVCAPQDLPHRRQRPVALMPLRRLREPSFGQRLIIVSDGGLLVDEAGVWREAARQARFHRWRERVLFTPAEPRDWGVREEQIERAERVNDPGFIVLPLEESALRAWMDLVLSGQLSTIMLSDPQRFPQLLHEDRDGRFVRQEAPPPEVIERLLRQLYLYLGDRGFYWLAALAVTPVVRWELTLLLGKATLGRLPQLADPQALSVSLARNYRRLVRLPWLRRELFPDWLRLRLLLELPRARQTELRTQVDGLLRNLPPTGVPGGLALDFERPPAAGERTGGVREGEGDALYLGYMSGLSPDQLVLRAPRAWASWASQMPLRREPGWRGRASRMRERMRASYARWIWTRGVPHLGLNRRVLFLFALLLLPLAIGLVLAGRGSNTGVSIRPHRFLEARRHAVVARPSSVMTAPLTGMIQAVVFSNDDREVAALQGDSQVSIWSAADGAFLGSLAAKLERQPGRPLASEPRVIELPSRLDVLSRRGPPVASSVNDGSTLPQLVSRHTLATSRDPQRVASVHGSAIWLLDGRQTTAVELLNLERGIPREVAINADGTRVAAAHADGSLHLMLVDDGVPIKSSMNVTLKVDGQATDVTSVALTPDGRKLFAGERSGMLRVWDTGTTSVNRAMPGHASAITRVTVSDDGARVASASDDRTVRFWNVQTLEPVGPPLRHASTVTDIAFSRDNRRFVSGTADGTLRFWNAKPGVLVRRSPAGTAGRVNAVAFSPDGLQIASGGADGVVRIWDAETLEPLAETKAHSGEVTALAFSSDGRSLSSGGADGLIRVWDSGTWRTVAQLPFVAGNVSGLAYGPGTEFASASGNVIRHWHDNAAPSAVSLERGAVSLTYAPDGRHLLAVDETAWTLLDPARLTVTRREYLWASPPTLKKAPTIDRAASVATFTPDSQRIVTMSVTGPATIWDAQTGARIRELADDIDVTTGTPSLTYADRGRYLLTSRENTGIRVWNASTFEPMGSRLETGGPVAQLAASPIGPYVAVAIAGGDAERQGVQLWRLDLAPLPDADTSLSPERMLTAINRPKTLNWLAGAACALYLVAIAQQTRRMRRLIRTSRTEP